ncbi:NAD(P)H-dependent oxidoreductase [Enterocloster citroniae]|uniref:NAD(P)H-dependent oxidoreductase n=1 Tax=Enterocloster citroniae TaxID=358743 RepID=UPI00349E9D2E
MDEIKEEDNENIFSDDVKDDLVKLHQQEIKEADGIVIIHPNWWGQPTAVLKGYTSSISLWDGAFVWSGCTMKIEILILFWNMENHKNSTVPQNPLAFSPRYGYNSTHKRRFFFARRLACANMRCR